MFSSNFVFASCALLSGDRRRRRNRPLGSSPRPSTNLTVATAYTNKPAARLQRRSICSSVGQLPILGRWRAISNNSCLKNNPMSCATLLGSTSWRLNTCVAPANSGSRKPFKIRGAGRLVTRNLTVGISMKNCPRTERIAEVGSSSVHSSKASMMISVEILDSLRGWTINLCIWLYRDSWEILGLDRARGTRRDRNLGYLRASWTARVGKINWRLLRSSKSREQKNEAPSCPSTNVLSAIVWAIVVFPVPASPFNQKMGRPMKGLPIQKPISSRTVTRVPFRQPLRSPDLNSAPCAQRKLLRTVASSLRHFCQACMTENRGCSDLGSAERLFRLLRLEG